MEAAYRGAESTGKMEQDMGCVSTSPVLVLLFGVTALTSHDSCYHCLASI